MPCQDHALVGKRIQIRRRELLLPFSLILPKDTDVSGAQVIAQNENDVGSVCCDQRTGRYEPNLN
jgi:hypothetical protein